jgi:Arm DNA-binding domain
LLALGAYPDLSLAKARDARDEARKALAQGIDPSAVRQREKREKAAAGADDFETIAREWLENVRDKWAPVYHSDTLKRFEAYVFPGASDAERPLPDARGTIARRTEG